MRLSENVTSIFAENEDGTTVTMQTIMDRVSVKSFSILLAIFSLPSALPLPAPGYSIPGGLALLFLGVQIMRRREYPWLPDRVLKKEVHIGKKPRLISFMIRFLKIFEFFIRPRLTFVFENSVMYRLLGFMITLCAISMLIPIPLTNTAPAFGVFVIGLGMLEEDGFLSALGVLAGIIGLTLSVTVLFFVFKYGLEGADMLKDIIKGFIKSFTASSEPTAMLRMTLALFV